MNEMAKRKRGTSRQAHRSRALFVPEMFKPTLEKLTVSLAFLAVLFLLLLLDVPDWLFGPVTTVLAWPLLWLAGGCQGEFEHACTQASSFIGLLLTLFYWYFTASLFSEIFKAMGRRR